MKMSDGMDLENETGLNHNENAIFFSECKYGKHLVDVDRRMNARWRQRNFCLPTKPFLSPADEI